MSQKKAEIIVVDSDKQFQANITNLLGKRFALSIAESFEGAEKMFSDGLKPFIIILDNSFDRSGLINQFVKKHSDTYFIITSSTISAEAITKISNNGAIEFLPKPLNTQVLLEKIFNVLQTRAIDIPMLNRAEASLPKEDILFAGMRQDVKELIKGAINSDITVALFGETGVGKSLIAKYIHLMGGRKQGPFNSINCAAIPETMLEAELFGYEAGAFTGATVRKFGLFEIAQNGTLFLDEIGEMSLNLQAKILTAIEEKAFKRLGGTQDVKVNGRIIISTNCDLRRKVAEKSFREDLFYRIATFPIYLPPLRYRKSAIPIFIEYFISEYSEKNKLKVEGHISAEIIKKMSTYNWPGNVRELAHTVERELVLCHGQLENAVFNKIPSLYLSRKRVLPRILIIDDQYASSKWEGLRKDLCTNCGFMEIQLDTPDDQIEFSIDDDTYTAAAVFCSGQRMTETTIFNYPQTVLDHIQNGWPSLSGWRWALILLDVRFDSGIIDKDGLIGTAGDEEFGITLLKKILVTYPESKSIAYNTALPVVMLSGLTDYLKNRIHKISVESGALEYIEKRKLTAVSQDIARQTIRDLLDRRGLIEDDRGIILGRSFAILTVLREARKLARLNSGKIIIEAENSTGRTEIAKYIHAHSGRVINSLIEHSSLTDVFDYTAVMSDIPDDKASFLGETLLVSDIELQGRDTISKLQNLIKRDSEDCLIVTCGINDDSGAGSENVLLRQLKGTFSYHLFIPPLRDRKEDINLLFFHFLKKASDSIGDNVSKKMDDGAKELLQEHAWLGNLAELHRIALSVASEAWNEPVIYSRHLHSLMGTAVPKRIDLQASLTKLGPIEADKIRDLEIKLAELNNRLAQSLSFERLIDLLRNIEIPTDVSKLNGVMTDLNSAYTDLLKRLIGAALLIKDKKHEVAIQMLLNDNKLEGSQVARFINRIIGGKLFAIRKDEGANISGKGVSDSTKNKLIADYKSTRNETL